MNIKTVAEHEFFRALAEPSRLRIVSLLLNGERCVCELTTILDLPQPTISRHMSTLKSTGLVADRRAGRWVYYSLADSPPLNALKPYLQTLRGQEPYRSDRHRLEQHKKVPSC